MRVQISPTVHRDLSSSGLEQHVDNVQVAGSNPVDRNIRLTTGCIYNKDLILQEERQMAKAGEKKGTYVGTGGGSSAPVKKGGKKPA